MTPASGGDLLQPDVLVYTPPMQMLENGQIVEKVPDELDPLMSEPMAEDVPAEFADPLTHAIEQFRRRGASEQDKRSALRQLAGVLEPLREDIKKHAMSADERDFPDREQVCDSPHQP